MGIKIIDILEAKNGAFQGLIPDDEILGVADGFLDEDDMASDSAIAFCSQQSIKKFVEDNAAKGTKFVTITIQPPAADLDVVVARVNEAVTITKVVSVIVGGTSVTIDPEHGTDRSLATNDILSAAMTCNSKTVGVTSTSFDDATLPANSFIVLKSSAMVGEVTELSVTFFYTTD
jgi:hypothetical protein